MDVALTITDLFKLILFLLGIGALTFLILVFKNINQLLSKINALYAANEKNLNRTISQLPEISENVNSITKSTEKVVNDLTPEVSKLVQNVSDISSKVGSITQSVESTTHSVTETLDIVSDSVSETAYAFKHNVKSIDNYIKIFVEIVEALRNYLKRK